MSATEWTEDDEARYGTPECCRVLRPDRECIGGRLYSDEKRVARPLCPCPCHTKGARR